MTAGIILAAGQSRRMGSPKALLPYQGETFLDHLIGLFTSRCEVVIAVLGAEERRIREGISRPAAFAVNPDYARGMITSLQCGLRALPPDVDSVLFTLVDHPAVSGASLDALVQTPLPLLRVPRHAGKRGHPILFRRELIAEFLAVPADAAASQVVRAHAADTEFLDLDDPGIVADIDDPEAYRTLIGAGV